jgi:uroporphyrinogen decarboxylase
VLAALNHQESDRVPIDLGSTRNTGILAAPYQALVEYLNLQDEIAQEDGFGMTKLLGLVPPDEVVLQRLDVDLRGIFIGKPDKVLEKMLPDGTHQDDFGVIRQRPPGSYYFDVISSPLDKEITVPDIAQYPWPDPYDPGYVRGLREQAIRIRENTPYALVLHTSDIMVHTSQYMRGFERWYMDMVLAPDLIGALMDAILELRLCILEQALDAVGDLVDVVSCSDDVADQRGSAVSPKTYREVIKPRHQRYMDQIRSQTQAKILFHSCGAVSSLITDFLDMGIDFINPVQVSAQDMDPVKLKKKYGDQLGFWGGIDTMHTLPFGSEADVRSEVRQRIRELSSDGGYILTAVHNIQPDVPPQNIVAMYEEAKSAK